MSFTITLQKNTSELNRVQKSITNVITLTGSLRNESDVVNPTILVEVPSFPDCNYLTIGEFKRSYFIKDIKSVRNNLWEINAHSDPLYSFRSELLSNTGLIMRQENNWDLYINDGVFKVKQNARVGYLAFPGGFDTFNYILLAAGGSTSSSS